MEIAKLFSDVQKIQKKGIRSSARHLALDVLGAKTQLAPKTHLWSTPRIQFIYIHHVFQDERKGFIRMMEFFAENFSFISYSDAVNRILNKNIDKPYMAFSSDDGFKNNMIGAEILERFDTSACFFLNPGTIGLTDKNKLRSHCASRLNFPPVEFLSWNEVHELQQRGHEIGSHTVWHSNLSEVNVNEVREDLLKSKELIEAECGSIAHFAFPYGRWAHFNKEALQATFEAGYTSCASAERGCHLPNSEVKAKDLVIRRDHLLANWPVKHMRYFLEKNIERAENEKHPHKLH